MEKASDFQYESSHRDFKNFITSSLWRDMKKELGVWLEMARDECEEKETLKDVFKAQGKADAVRHLQEMPENIMESLGDNNDS